MCFRPAAIESNKKCPACGAACGPIDVSCAQCGAELPVTGAPGAPGIPSASGAPGAPKAPGTPGKPVAPVAPGK